MELQTIIEIAVGVVAFIGVCAAGYLKFIAPKTKTKVDDKVVGGIKKGADFVTDALDGEDEEQ